jgi:hypothetical protein
MADGDLWKRFSHDPRHPDNAGLRASDRDRDVIHDVLGSAYSEGRLRPDELDERSDTAARAQTLGELPAIVDDLVARTPAVGTRLPAVDHGAEAERRYRRLLALTRVIWLVPTLICWVVWGSVLLGGGGTNFPWPIFPTLGTAVPLLIVLAGHKEIVAMTEGRLERRDRKFERRLARRQQPPPGQLPGS